MSARRSLRAVCLCAMLLILFVGAFPLQAQVLRQPSWDAVKQLPSGERIVIDLTDSRQQKGEFVNAQDDALAVRSGERTFTYRRSEVRRVGVRGPSKRLRNLALGAVIGAAGGLVSAAASKGKSERGFVTGMNTLIGLGVGTGVGAALPADRYRTIYTAATAENGPPLEQQLAEGPFQSSNQRFVGSAPVSRLR